MKISKLLLASLIASSISCSENNVVEQVTNVDTTKQEEGVIEEPVEKLKPCILTPPPPPAEVPETNYYNGTECPSCGMG